MSRPSSPAFVSSPPSPISPSISPTPSVTPLPSDAPTTTTNSTTNTPDTGELAEFRQKWKEEVREKERSRWKTKGNASGATAKVGDGTDENAMRGVQRLAGKGQGQGQGLVFKSLMPLPLSPGRRSDVQAGTGVGIGGRPASAHTSPSIPNVVAEASTPTSSVRPLPQHPQQKFQYPPRLNFALELYAKATLEEQRGNLSEATNLYRRAFQLDSHVDKVHQLEETAREKALLTKLENEEESYPPSASTAAPLSSSSPLSVSVTQQFGQLNLESSESRSQHPAKVVDTHSHQFKLLPLVSSWTDPAPELLPSDERRPVFLAKIPNELIIYILITFVWNTDAASIERFALVCRKMRSLTLDGSIWRKFLEVNLVRHQLSEPDVSIDELCFGLYESDYRRMFIEHPRIRFDGVYIAICHYIRRGLGENPWMTVSHLITYRRFLRFFPNGKVLSYQANEDQEISEVVHSLQPSLIKKDVRIGNWQLLGSWLYITNLTEVAPSRFRNVDKFNFQMRLSLKSKPCLGRWNKLDLLDYESVDIETGDVSPFALRHERPYWFSKVRSYTF